MRGRIVLDDGLIRLAHEVSGITDQAALIREALKSLIERESARRLALLGGTMPTMGRIPRRRPQAPKRIAIAAKRHD